MATPMTWTERPTVNNPYTPKPEGSIWDSGASVWDVNGNVAQSVWDVTVDVWSNQAQIDTVWSDA